MSQTEHHATTSWQRAIEVYRKPQVVSMLFLGFSAGLPLLLIFSSLSLWLSEAGVDREYVTYFSWAALAYSFKFVWAPLLDKLPLPFLYARLGRRRSWLLVTQLMIIAALIWMASVDPQSNLQMMAMAAVLLGFAAASQDVVIDAYRIEVIDKQSQAAMSAMYVAGYRIAMLVAGAGALYLAEWLGSSESYLYIAWQRTYLVMAMLMLVGVATTLLIKEPEDNVNRAAYLHSGREYAAFLLLFFLVTATFVLAFIVLNPALLIQDFLSRTLYFNDVLASFIGQFNRLLLAIMVAYVVIRLIMRSKWMAHSMVEQTYVLPVKDFFQRYGKHAVLILLLIGFYRVSDIVLGVISNVFYFDLGFSKAQIASLTKVFGLLMTLFGGFVGGVLTMRYGIMRILLLGAVLAAATNLLFMLLAYSGKNELLLAVVIAADNVSAGLASAAFIAYLSSLTSISFTAMQYAVFSSLMTLFPKLLGGYSGSIVNQLGYSGFFLITALLGIPVILLVWYLNKTLVVENDH